MRSEDSPPGEIIGAMTLALLNVRLCMLTTAELRQPRVSFCPASTMRSETLRWLLVLTVSNRLSSGCMSVPGLGPAGQSDNRGDFHEDAAGDIFSHGEQPDFGFEGFQHDGFGFDFGEGFSHDGGEDGGYERRGRLRHERGQEEQGERRLPVYGQEDRQEEDYWQGCPLDVEDCSEDLRVLYGIGGL